MRIRPSAAILALSIAATLPVRADAAYEKTSWGMSISEVENLYPGGWNSTDPATGQTEYTVITSTSGLRDIRVSFTFRDGGLIKVFVAFGSLGADKKAENGKIEGWSKTQAMDIFQSVLVGLEKKYGRPVRPPSETAIWNRPDGENIFLAVVACAANCWVPVIIQQPLAEIERERVRKQNPTPQAKPGAGPNSGANLVE